MKRIFLRLKQPLRNERGEITFFACFFVVGIVMLISFLLLYASIRIIYSSISVAGAWNRLIAGRRLLGGRGSNLRN